MRKYVTYNSVLAECIGQNNVVKYNIVRDVGSVRLRQWATRQLTSISIKLLYNYIYKGREQSRHNAHLHNMYIRFKNIISLISYRITIQVFE